MKGQAVGCVSGGWAFHCGFSAIMAVEKNTQMNIVQGYRGYLFDTFLSRLLDIYRD